MATTLGVTEMLPNVAGIYQIRNPSNDRIYIGSTINLARRYKEHLYSLLNNNHSNLFLQNDFNKSGKNFLFLILERSTKEQILCLEQQYLSVLYDEQKRCYNFSKFARARYGKHSLQTKKKISNSLKNKPKTKEHRMKISLNKKEISKSVLQYSLLGELINSFGSISQASKQSNIAKASIMKVLNRERYQAGGFLWVHRIEEAKVAKERYLQNKNIEMVRKRNQLLLRNPRKK